MTSALGVALTSIVLGTVLAVFGWLIRDLLKGIRDDIGHLAGVLTDAADKMGGIDRRVTRLEALFDLHLLPGGRRITDPPR